MSSLERRRSNRVTTVLVDTKTYEHIIACRIRVKWVMAWKKKTSLVVFTNQAHRHSKPHTSSDTHGERASEP